jgi:RHS repeat-associated protein
VFTGRFYDEESGLYYYRARYYDPTLGRFLQRDPLGYRAGPTLYAYVDNNPWQSADPAGLKKTKEEEIQELCRRVKALEKLARAVRGKIDDMRKELSKLYSGPGGFDYRGLIGDRNKIWHDPAMMKHFKQTLNLVSKRLSGATLDEWRGKKKPGPIGSPPVKPGLPPFVQDILDIDEAVQNAKEAARNRKLGKNAKAKRLKKAIKKLEEKLKQIEDEIKKLKKKKKDLKKDLKAEAESEDGQDEKDPKHAIGLGLVGQPADLSPTSPLLGGFGMPQVFGGRRRF